MAWEGRYEVDDYKLLCVYSQDSSSKFKTFEKNSLLGNSKFVEFKLLEENKGVYIFDLSSVKEEWDKILQGKYSKLLPDSKTQLQNYFGLKSNYSAHLNMILFPEKHFKEASKILGVNESILKEVGELCSSPDLNRETLKIKEVTFNFNLS